MIEIKTAADAAKLREYEAARDNPRTSMANGVYPNCLVALSEYDTLVNRLSDAEDLGGYGEFHAEITAPVTAYIDRIRSAMQTIVSTMQAIEKAAPGTFGIEVPADE